MAFHVLSILARGSEPCGRSPVLRDERFVSRLFVGFSQPSPKQLHHDFAHLTPFDGALRLDAPIQDIRNLNGCFHLAKVTVFPYSRQELIPGQTHLNATQREEKIHHPLRLRHGAAEKTVCRSVIVGRLSAAYVAQAVSMTRRV